MKFIKNYGSTLILIGSIILGALLGIMFKDDAFVLKPFGDIFLNMLLVIVVPLIFLSITTSIYKMKQPKRIGKILVTTFILFLVTSIISVLIGIFSTYSFKLVDSSDSFLVRDSLVYDENVSTDVELNILDKIVLMTTVDDFYKLFSRENMISLIVVSILVGFSMYMAKDKAKPLFEFLDSSYEVVNKFIKIIMYYAPIGICCYFAALVSQFGSSIAVGYLKTFIVYLIASLFLYFVIYTIYAYISAGVNGVKVFYRNILPVTFTALSTCSSAASMPVNISFVKKMGVSSDIAETTVSLGTSFHKDGSSLGGVFKIMFLVYLFNDFSSISFLKIIWISIVSTLLVTAVPIGGGTISEMLIITMLGYPVYTLPILTMIATIIDPPATVLNVVGDSSLSMLISRVVDGRNWLKEKAS